MILSIEQINELINIINKNQVVIIAKELGEDFLTSDDTKLLHKYGINYKDLYNPAEDSLFNAFNLGMLAESLYANNVRGLKYDTLKEYISSGNYIPLTTRELATLNAIRNQAFTDLKKLGNKIFTDVNQVLTDRTLSGQRAFIREELESGTLKKQTVTEIAHTIAEKTGDWSRDFERIIAYNSHLSTEEGKAAMIERNTGEEDPIVYKTVFQGACDHCIRLYLTDGFGSQPILFKLSELRANGTNIGVKTKDWKSTLGPVHPFCRCRLTHLPNRYIWNNKTKQFNPSPETRHYIPKRKPIRATIGGKEVLI